MVLTQIAVSNRAFPSGPLYRRHTKGTVRMTINTKRAVGISNHICFQLPKVDYRQARPIKIQELEGGEQSLVIWVCSLCNLEL